LPASSLATIVPSGRAPHPAEIAREGGGSILAFHPVGGRTTMWRPPMMKRDLAVAVLALAILAPACGTMGESDPVDGTFSQALSSAEEDGVLRFVNDCQTTQPALDDDAALDVRAATGIVDRRNGTDAACGTADDQPFASLAELDAVPYVGDVALSKLLAQATLLGYVTDDNDGLADDYDGVSFSLDEARGVLAIANGASFENLDVDFGLDSRAATAIVAGRPFAAATTGASMQELSAASYVGGSALQHLKSQAGAWAACADASATVRGVAFSSLDAHDTLDLLNQAPIDVLTRISGIGPVIAGRIDAARPFEDLAHLGDISGIGPSVVGHVHDETGTRWCPLLGARCGCAPGLSYRPPYVAFDENGLYYFLAYGTPWQAERTVDAGSLSQDAGGQVVLTGVQVSDDPDHWQDITVQVFQRLWASSFQYQYVGDPIVLGSNRQGVLHLGRVINAHDDKPYVLAYWQDIDDASMGWLYAKDASGAWVEQGEVFLN
jgi:Helix-hairpin-helix motif